MPEVDYRTWYKYQQQRAAEGKPTDIQPEYGPVGYQPESWKEQRGELLRTGKEGLQGAAQGASIGANFGPKGALIGGAIGAGVGLARGYINEAKEGIEAYKEGDSQSLSRNPLIYMNPFTAPAAAWSVARRQLGLSKDWDPLDWGARAARELFGGSRTNIESKRWERLKEAGFDVPKWVDQGKQAKFDVERKDLGEDFVGYDPQGNWVNNKFAKSRDEKDLTAQDLQQYAVMPETFGSLWQGASQEARDQVANMAITDAKIRERLGTLEMEWTPENLKMAQDVLAQSIEQDPNVQQRRFWVPPTEKYVPPEERGPRSGYELMGPQVPYEQMNPYTRGRR
ncbi:MAG: hypothetical protein ACO3S8_00720 [Aquiluna sp.]